jgi:hypothetical protein
VRKTRFSTAHTYLAFCFALTLLVAYRISAAHAQGVQLAPSLQIIEEIRDHARQWRSSANIQIGLLIGVGVFGAVISALHRLNYTWAKNCVLLLGLLSSAFTVINNSGVDVFSADYRTLRRAASETDLVVLQMEQILGTANQPSLGADDRIAVYQLWNQQVTEYTNIVHSIEGSSASTSKVKSAGLKLLSLPAVEAQSEATAPAWISSPPGSPTNFNFVGVGSDTSLAKAKDRSMADAREQIARAFTLRPPYAPTDTRINAVQSSAVPQDVYYRYDKSSSAFTFFTLISIARNLRDVLSPTAEIQKKGWFPVDLAFDPVAGLFVLDQDGGIGQVTYTGSGIQVQQLFHLPHLPFGAQAIAVATRKDAVYVSTASAAACTVYEYSLKSKALKPTFVGQSQCDGIATDGTGIYLAMPDAEEVRHWVHWGDRTYQSLGVPERTRASRYCVLHYDATAQRLLFAGASGNSYQLSTSNWKWSYLDSKVGFVHAIGSDWNRILFASGKSVLFYDRQSNTGVDTAPSLKETSRGTIYGLAVDSSDSVWIADHDNSTIRGPFRLN